MPVDGCFRIASILRPMRNLWLKPTNALLQ
jgi:hypothetical protein